MALPVVQPRVNNARIDSLLSSLDNAVNILAEQRTPDAICVTAFDTLKQARALVLRAFEINSPCLAYPGADDEDAEARPAA